TSEPCPESVFTKVSVGTSQTLISPPELEASLVESGDQVTDIPPPRKIFSMAPVWASQIIVVLSGHFAVEAILVASGDQATARTSSVCPVSVASPAPVLAFQTLSSLPELEAILPASGDQEMDTTPRGGHRLSVCAAKAFIRS